MKYSTRQSALSPVTTAQVLENANDNARACSFSVARQVVVTVTVVLISLITILVSTG